jgi:hypothetical protein
VGVSWISATSRIFWKNIKSINRKLKLFLNMDLSPFKCTDPQAEGCLKQLKYNGKPIPARRTPQGGAHGNINMKYETVFVMDNYV